MPITSRFYYKNILRRAEYGLGDGTVYASATVATIDQDAKTFELSGLSILADLGADANDLFNSMILYFPESENVYHIVDWDAATDTATVFETPSTDDTGACEIRLNFWADATDADNPVHRLCDGKKSTIWMGSAVNQTQTIRVYLPNLIEDGGFEAQSVGDVASPWSSSTSQWQISATSPLAGSRMAVVTPGVTSYIMNQISERTLEKGKTYRILIKAQALTDDPAGNVLTIYIYNYQSYVKVVTGMNWYPEITTTAKWLETTFVPEFTTDHFAFFLHALPDTGNWGSCTGINIDEIYLYEDIAVDRLIAMSHGLNNGEITSLYGCRCNPDRTSFSYANDASSNLLDGIAVSGTEHVVQEVTESKYPVWELVLAAASGIQYYAAIIFLGQAMAFSKQNIQPFDPDAETVGGVLSETQSGRRTFYPDYYRGGPYDINFSKINSTFYNMLKDWWEEVGRAKFPFLYCFDEENCPERVKLIRNESDWLFPYDPVRRSGSIKASEEL